MERLSLAANAELLSTTRAKLSERQAWTMSQTVARQIGVTRIAEIGQFVDSSIHVCQTTRPSLLRHYSCGLNTGSQGKGYSRERAGISAVMEAVESFCAEPRVPSFVRGSFLELSRCHAIAEPNQFVPTNTVGNRIAAREPLMWSSALHYATRREVLIPAELVFLFTMSSFYDCRTAFHEGSWGMGAGFDYPRAIRKAILERIEVHYRGHIDCMQAQIEELIPDGPVRRTAERTSAAFREQNDTLFYAVTLPGLRENLPMVVCCMGDARRHFFGYGIALDPLAALESAHLEAFQVWATRVSGTREDLPTSEPVQPAKRRRRFLEVWPAEATLSYAQWATRFRRLRAKRDDVDTLAQWLAHNGYPHLYLANLSREGIDCKVVRAAIPGLAGAHREYRRPATTPKGLFQRLADREYLIARHGEQR